MPGIQKVSGSNTTVTITTATPKRDGHEFKGWSAYKDGTAGTTWTNYQNVLQPGDTITLPNASVKLYAMWTVEVTFDAQGGTVSQTSKTVVSGSTYGTLPTPSITGYYTFGGWYTNDGKKVTAGTNVTTTLNHTLYAQWNLISNGSYIRYEPTVTEYEVNGRDAGTWNSKFNEGNQTFNPSETKSWRIFSNSGTHLQIISAGSIGELKLRGSG